MTTAVQTAPSHFQPAVSPKEALRLLEQAWAYFTPEPRPAAAPEEPRDRHDAVQLFAYYRPGL